MIFIRQLLRCDMLPHGVSESVSGLLTGVLITTPSGLLIPFLPALNAVSAVLLGASLVIVFFCLVYASNSVEIKKVWYSAVLLGWVLGCGLIFVLFSPASCRQFGWYMIVLAAFHYSEFVVTTMCSAAVATTSFPVPVAPPPDSILPAISADSFLINHSTSYSTAASLSWLEFWLRWILLPSGWCQYDAVFYAGLALCCTGETLRKAAMLTAGSNFTHIIQDVRRPGHMLITRGVYSLMRHPSYVGWFLWSIGTQLILCNPVCFVLYAVASWLFFRERVIYEEHMLIRFFGRQYLEYQRRVPSGLPAIYGCRLPPNTH